MLTCNRTSDHGFTLIELMISMTLGMGLLTALVSFVSINLTNNAKLLMRQRLQQELHSIVTLIKRDIRRAGFDQNAAATLINKQNLLSPFAGQLSVSEFPGEIAASCIIYAFDKNQDGVFDRLNHHEGYGFRLRHKAIEMRQGGKACDENGWQDISDAGAINIDHLEFAWNNANKQLTLQIAASMRRYSNMQYSVEQVVMLSNEF